MSRETYHRLKNVKSKIHVVPLTYGASHVNPAHPRRAQNTHARLQLGKIISHQHRVRQLTERTESCAKSNTQDGYVGGTAGRSGRWLLGALPSSRGSHCTPPAQGKDPNSKFEARFN